MRKKIALTNLFLCSVMHGFNHFAIIFFKPLNPSIAEYFGLENVGVLTSAVSMFYAAYAVSNLLSGIFALRFGLKNMLTLGSAGMSASMLLVAFIPADGFPLFVLAIVACGLGGGTYHPAANTLIVSSFEAKPGRAIGFLSMGASLGFSLAPFFGQYVGEAIGFRNMFLITGAFGLLFTAIFFVLAADPPIDAPDIRTTGPHRDKRLGRGKMFFTVIALMCIPVTLREIVGWSFYEITPFWEKSGFSGGISIGMVQSMQYLPGIVVQPLVGMLCDRFRPVATVVATFAAMGVGMALCALGSTPAIWAALALFGIGTVASTVASETYMGGIAGARDRGIVYGVTLTVGLGLGGVVSGLSGWVVDYFGVAEVAGYNAWFVASGLLLAASTVTYFLIEKLRKKHGA